VEEEPEVEGGEAGRIRQQLVLLLLLLLRAPVRVRVHLVLRLC